MEASELDLEVNEVDIKSLEELYHIVVYHESILCNSIDLLLSCKTKSESVVVVDKGIAQVIVLVAEFKGRLL